MSAFSEWEDFYVIVGSSAGALIGLQFVVVTLIAERPPLRVAEAGAAFSTPSVVHFAVVLPFVAYAMLGASAPGTHIHAGAAMFLVGGATLLLLFVGIHNAWDAVTYHVFTRQAGERPAHEERKEGKSKANTR